MSQLEVATAVARDHPLDLLEEIVEAYNWVFERLNDDELSITVQGSWSDYSVSVTWSGEMAGLHIACALETRIPPHKSETLTQLLTMINERLWAGHFDHWREEGLVVYRNSLLLGGGAEAAAGQLDHLVRIAVDACERHYAAVQYVVWAGKRPEEALAAALFETEGNA